MIDIAIAPEVLVCGRATDVVIEVTNQSTENTVYSVIVEIEPDSTIRLDSGTSRIEIDEMRPGTMYPHPLILTGRMSGDGHIKLPHLAYRTSDGRGIRPTKHPLRVRIDPSSAPAGSTAVPQPRPAPTPAVVPAAFISHRRADNGWIAHHLHAEIARHLPGSHVFLDHYDLRPGDEWRPVIDEELRRADALLALIGPEWETITDGSGIARIWQGDDIVRHEIATALRRRIVVIPVLYDRTAVPAAESLPLEIRSLTNYQGVVIDHSSDRDAIRRIAVRLRSAGFR